MLCSISLVNWTTCKQIAEIEKKVDVMLLKGNDNNNHRSLNCISLQNGKGGNGQWIPVHLSALRTAFEPLECCKCLCLPYWQIILYYQLLFHVFLLPCIASEYRKDFPLIPGRYDIIRIDALASSVLYSIWWLPLSCYRHFW